MRRGDGASPSERSFCGARVCRGLGRLNARLPRASEVLIGRAMGRAPMLHGDDATFSVRRAAMISRFPRHAASIGAKSSERCPARHESRGVARWLSPRPGPHGLEHPACSAPAPNRPAFCRRWEATGSPGSGAVRVSVSTARLRCVSLPPTAR